VSGPSGRFTDGHEFVQREPVTKGPILCSMLKTVAISAVAALLVITLASRFSAVGNIVFGQQGA
jgi:hypothetical protein